MRIAPSRRRCVAALLAAAFAAAAVAPGDAGAAGDEDRVSRLERKVADLEEEVGNIDTELTIFEWIGAGSGVVVVIGNFVWIFVYRRQNRTEAEIRDFERNYEDEIVSTLGTVRETVSKLTRVANRISEEKSLEEFYNISENEWPMAHERLAEKLKDLDTSSIASHQNWEIIIRKYVDFIGDSMNIITKDRNNSKQVTDAVRDIEDAARGISNDVKTALTEHKASLRRWWSWPSLWSRS